MQIEREWKCTAYTANGYKLRQSGEASARTRGRVCSYAGCIKTATSLLLAIVSRRPNARRAHTHTHARTHARARPSQRAPRYLRSAACGISIRIPLGVNIRPVNESMQHALYVQSAIVVGLDISGDRY